MRFNNFWLGGLVIGWMSACAPKGMAESSDGSADDTSASDPSNGSDDTSGSSGVTTGMTGMTGMTGECTPGDTKPGPFDCGEECVCSNAGEWVCPVVFACSETGPVTTNETDETASGSTAGESTASESTASESGESGGTGETGTGETTGGTTVVELPSCDKLAPSDPFKLEKAAVVGDLLNVEVSFGGGCEKHDFVLCLVGFEGDTVLLGLDHDAHADPCDAFLMESRDLDLTPLQVLTSPLTMSLADWPNDLQYVF